MRVVLCNCPSTSVATDLARQVIEKSLAACVNVFEGVQSIYAWEGKICEDRETTLLIKVSDQGVGALREFLAKQHPYTVPEIVVLPVEAERSHKAYVDWVRESCG